ncbi:hypothetical protein [Flindersiella endophytica]
MKSDRVVRLAPAGAVVCSALFSLMQVALAFGYPSSAPGSGWWSLLGCALYLPLHLRHIWYTTHARQPPFSRWTLAAMAVVILGFAPLAGNIWPRTYVALAVTTVLVVRSRWSYVAAAGLVILAAPVAHTLGEEWVEAPWYSFTVLCGILALLLLVWLAAALERLRTAQEALAQQAVLRERRRIDDDLRDTLGSALESLVSRGERARDHLVPGELAGLTDDSRSALAEARQRIRGYQRTSLRTELETAVTLLSAAGIESRLELPRGDLPDTIAQQPRAALRTIVTRLLRDQQARTCVITLTTDAGRARLELRTADSTETIEVPA